LLKVVGGDLQTGPGVLVLQARTKFTEDCR